MGVGIVDLGKADEVITRSKGGIVAQKGRNLWTGGISPLTRSASDHSLERRIAAVLEPSRLEPYFVTSDLRAPTRCIDGRPMQGYETELSMQSLLLGPQVPGGTAISALTRRIVHAEPLDGAFTFTKDVEAIISLLQHKGLSFGGHIDNANHPHGDTGCGAVDRVPEVLATIANPAAQRQIRGLAEVLLGVRYDDAAVDAILGRIINLQSIAERYFDIDPHSGTYAYKQKIVAELQREDKVARLVGPHYEVGMVVNAVRATTFDTNRFSAEHDNEIQLFNYDFWFTLHASSLLYPVNHDVSYAVAKKNLRLQHEYILCRTLLAIAVAMVLTDGSINLLVRS